MNRYATCYICDELVYLFKVQCNNTLITLSSMFYQRRFAIVKNGIVLCRRCASYLKIISPNYERRTR
ncbi:hypothetical protein [Palpita vitrealis nucleopolyhedrovirus]|uniref:Uncharacterized protein n=1 Tax=Palpita vitrealis nucleopolyhedrovirus TaxID=2951960 RepID=A0AAE9LNG7_9ABAC|nr:hypothetical protein [Palpita vitrealis nucleopolyhedrovirus]